MSPNNGSGLYCGTEIHVKRKDFEVVVHTVPRLARNVTQGLMSDMAIFRQLDQSHFGQLGSTM
jgi:hypothetical protein